MPRKKEQPSALPSRPKHDTLKRHRIVLPPPPYQLVAKKEEIVSPPEEPKFYGADFAILMQSLRKMGTLRERDKKRAGLTKGMRLMSHIHPDAESPSIADIELVILDVYHGKLDEIFLKHKLAFFLDGIWSVEEAVRVLQKFSRNQITRHTEIDYFSFIQASLFDQMAESQERFLSLSVEEAMVDPEFTTIFYPSLCQSVAWHNLGLLEWIKFLSTIKAITPEKYQAWVEFELPSPINERATLVVRAQEMQEVLDFDPDHFDEAMYQLCILGKLEAFTKVDKTVKVGVQTRYLIIPCSSCHEEAYAIVDQAAGNTIVKWANEQEIEDLTAGSDGAPWDQAYSYFYPDEQKEPEKLVCPNCQKLS